MKAEHVTLIKKAIRMVDYMRADLVRILNESGVPSHPVPSPTSSLYAAFDAAAVPFRDKDLPAPGRHIDLTDAEVNAAAEHAAERLGLEPSDTYPGLVMSSPDTSTEFGRLVAGEGEPEAFEEPTPPTPREPTEYEIRKAELHGMRGSASQRMLADAIQPIFAKFLQTKSSERTPHVHVNGNFHQYVEFHVTGDTARAAINDWIGIASAYLTDTSGVVHWRVMPEIKHIHDVSDNKAKWAVYGRFVVVPE